MHINRRSQNSHVAFARRVGSEFNVPPDTFVRWIKNGRKSNKKFLRAGAPSCVFKSVQYLSLVEK